MTSITLTIDDELMSLNDVDEVCSLFSSDDRDERAPSLTIDRDDDEHTGINHDDGCHTPSSMMLCADEPIVTVDARFGAMMVSFTLSQGSSLASLAAEQCDIPQSESDVNFWIDRVVKQPSLFWCWRVNFDVYDITKVVNFRVLTINEQIWIDDAEDRGTLVFERKDGRAKAWIAHTANKDHVYWSDETGWTMFGLSSPVETVTGLIRRMNMRGTVVLRLMCPLQCIDHTKAGDWAQPASGSELLFRGAAALSGCFIFASRMNARDVKRKYVTYTFK